jgi:hypothetical protein
MEKTRGKKGITTTPKLRYPRELLKEHIQRIQVSISPLALQTLSTILDVVFFASLMVEESEPVRVGVVYAEHGVSTLNKVYDTEPSNEGVVATWDVTKIKPFPLDSKSLAKFSRGLEYGKQLAVIAGRGDRLRVEGTARRLPHTNGGNFPRIVAPRPGVIVFEKHFKELFRFEAGIHVPARIDVLGNTGPVRNAISRISGADCGSEGEFSYVEWTLHELLPKIRGLQTGAIVAIFPRKPHSRVLKQIKYKRSDPELFTSRVLAEYEQRRSYLFGHISAAGVRAPNEHVREEADRATELLDNAIDELARLSAVDGAVVVGPGLAVYGGGYLIESLGIDVMRKAHEATDASAKSTRRYKGSHGARHKAAFSFAWKNEGGVAFVVSEDGPVTCVMRIKQRLVVWPVHMMET